MTIKNFGLYIHWPFCVSKCPYCDFNSHVRAHIDEDLWTQSYVKELNFWGQKTTGRVLSSIFFGGGTPSLMSPQIVEAVLSRIGNYWKLSPDLEITLEANPNSAEQTKFKAFKEAGINRLSLGIQSLQPEALHFLGRAHGREEALRALEMASQIFDRYSFDLIYARPNQTLEQWEQELEEALGFAGDHLSLYQLTLEQGTAFYTQWKRGQLHLPDEKIASDFYEQTQEIMTKAGFPAYEVSNHARPGQESRHNLIYWRGQEYGALGPGAHGRLHLGSLTKTQRWATQNYRLPEKWLQAVQEQDHGLEQQVNLSQEEYFHEFLIMGLRLYEGVLLQDLEEIGGPSLEKKFSFTKMTHLIEEGFLKQQEGRLKPTFKGIMSLNAVLRYLVDVAK